MNLLSKLKSVDWKGLAKSPLIVFILIAAAFLGGRYSAPENTKIVTVDKVVEKYHEQTQVTQKVDIDALLQKVQEKVRVVNRDVVRVVEVKPDGTRIETETDKSHINTQENTKTNSETKTLQITDIKQLLDSYKSEEHSKEVIITAPKDKWRLGILTGYSRGSPAVLGAPPGLVFGGFAERQILGPVNLGAWATTNPGVGLQVSISF